MDTRYPAGGYLTGWLALPNAFANYKAPTAAELNNTANCLPISAAISFADTDIAMQASDTTNEPSWADEGNTTERGAAQYGGSISCWYPKNAGDGSDYANAYDRLERPGTRMYFVTRLDGKDCPVTKPAAAGDLVTVLDIETSSWSDTTEGEDSFRYTVGTLPKGNFASYVVVTDGTAPVVAITGAASVAVGASARLLATVAGRRFTTGVRWSVDDPTKASVSSLGVVTGISAGQVEVTATYEPTGTTATQTVTVGA